MQGEVVSVPYSLPSPPLLPPPLFFRPEGVMAVQGDVGDAEVVRRLVQQVEERFESVDLVINNAGANADRGVVVVGWVRRGLMAPCQHFAPCIQFAPARLLLPPLPFSYRLLHVCFFTHSKPRKCTESLLLTLYPYLPVCHAGICATGLLSDMPEEVWAGGVEG